MSTSWAVAKELRRGCGSAPAGARRCLGVGARGHRAASTRDLRGAAPIFPQ